MVEGLACAVVFSIRIGSDRIISNQVQEMSSYVILYWQQTDRQTDRQIRHVVYASAQAVGAWVVDGVREGR